MNNYGWPQRDAEAEKISFKLQCDKHITEYRIPTAEELELSNQQLLTQYKKFDLPKYLREYNRSEWSLVIDELKLGLKENASPGVPFNVLGTQNKIVLDRMGESFNDLVLDRIELMLAMSPEQLNSMSRKERMERGLMDPVRVFVKNEPHKRAKLNEGRVRLIMSVSIADKMIELLISKFACKHEIQNWESIPSKPGIGFTDEMYKSVYNDVMGCGKTMAYADISGWDWNVKQWQIVDEAESLILLCNDPSPVYAHLLRLKAILESESIYMFSDGTLVQPNFKGIVNSGKQRTGRGNSWMRVRLANLIGAIKIIAAGDDTVEQMIRNAIMKYLEYGIVCKDYVEITDGCFEFCSHWYTPTGVYPLNKNKMLMNLLHSNPKDWVETSMYLVGFLAELRDHPDLTEILSLIHQVGYFEVEGPQIIFDNE